MMDEHKVEFEKRWQQEVVRLKTEQAVYNDQVRRRRKMVTARMVRMVIMVRIVIIVRMIKYDDEEGLEKRRVWHRITKEDMKQDKRRCILTFLTPGAGAGCVEEWTATPAGEIQTSTSIWSQK